MVARELRADASAAQLDKRVQLFANIACPLSGMIWFTTLNSGREGIEIICGIAFTIFIVTAIVVLAKWFLPNNTALRRDERFAYLQATMQEFHLEISRCGTKVYHLDKEKKRLPNSPGLDPDDLDSYRY